jgi:hypothetical protein
VIQLKDRASYGDLCDAQDARAANGNLNAYFLSMGSSLSGLTIDELRGLDIEDGRALEDAVQVRAGKRSVEAEIPFGNQSTSPSPTSNPSSTPSPVEG